IPCAAHPSRSGEPRQELCRDQGCHALLRRPARAAVPGGGRLRRVDGGAGLRRRMTAFVARPPEPRWRRASPSHPRRVFLLFWLLGSLLFAFIAIPLVALGLSSSVASLGRMAATLDVRQSLALSVEAAFLTAGVAALIGVPLAYLLARADFPGK